jgi:hypothetical protein
MLWEFVLVQIANEMGLQRKYILLFMPSEYN